MSFDWRGLSAAEMELHFNPRATVSGVDARLAEYAARSEQARADMPGLYDLRYGERAKETLDVHTPQGANGNPLVLFIHGGYWRALDKSDHSFVAPALLESGAVVANVNYDLCPSVTLDTIVEEIANAVVYCRAHAQDWGADPGSIYLVGHSAGAHLAAEMMLRDWAPGTLPASALRGVAALTGIYEPEVILRVSVNEEAQIDADVAARRSCLGRPFTRKPRTLIAAGAREPQGWAAQSIAFARTCERAGVPSRLETVPDCDHFTLLERAVETGHPLHEAVTGLWR